MHILTIFLTLSISLQALACPAFKMVEPAEPSPCKGIFLNQSTNEQVKKDLRNGELRAKQLELKDIQLVEIRQDRNAWQYEAKKQSELSHRKDNDMRNGIIAGVGLTLLSIFLVRQVDK